MTTKTYPCISIRQPWVWGIFHAGKDIENRDWPMRVRGRVLVQASAGMTHREYDDFLVTAHAVSEEHRFPAGLTVPAFNDLPRGCIVGAVTIVDCVSRHPSPWFFGEYGFVLADPKPLAVPVPYRGALRFFRVPASAIPSPTETQP